ncbi:CU044_5270 family protein [Actinoplanes sp. NPDC051633]|uniref:CU044_5270 family protein n=1 Tax=Actinoplanes sp. NPDC051633 TaxID=3155670 RepID=UPI0034139885
MSRDVFDLLTDARPARLEPPTTDAGAAAAAIVGHAVSRPRRRLALVLGSAGVTAAAAATAIALTVTGASPATVQGPSQQPAPQPLTAGQILLAAADRSTQSTLGAGRYLVVREESGSVLPVDAGGGDTYAMLGKTEYESWLVRSGRGDSVTMSRRLGWVPASPADAQVWRGLGSPARISVLKPTPTGLRRPGSPVDTTPGERQRDVFKGSDVYAIGQENASLANLEELPTEPAALRRKLLSLYRGGGGDLPTDRDEWLLTVTGNVVVGLPVSGAVRAAAYRVLADLPGVRALGPVRDQRGRAGEGVAFTWSYRGAGKVEERLIIEPATGRALSRETRVIEPGGATAWMRPGGLSTYQLILGVETTDDTPPA